MIFLLRNRSLHTPLFSSQSNLVHFSFKLPVKVCLTVLCTFILDRFHRLKPKFSSYNSLITQLTVVEASSPHSEWVLKTLVFIVFKLLFVLPALKKKNKIKQATDSINRVWILAIFVFLEFVLLRDLHQGLLLFPCKNRAQTSSFPHKKSFYVSSSLSSLMSDSHYRSMPFKNFILEGHTRR